MEGFPKLLTKTDNEYNVTTTDYHYIPGYYTYHQNPCFINSVASEGHKVCYKARTYMGSISSKRNGERDLPTLVVTAVHLGFETTKYTPFARKRQK